MLPIAIVQWRPDQATLQASDDTWVELVGRLRAQNPPQTRIIAQIEQVVPSTRRASFADARRITFSAQEGEIVYQAAKN